MATNTSAIYDSLVAKYGKEKADAAIGAASSSTATKETVQAAVSPTAAPKETVQPKQETVQPKQETYKYDANTGYYTTTSNSANIWNNLSYEKQQKALTDNPQLKQYLDTKGLTQKSAPVDVSGANQYNVETRPETSAPAKKESEWDYQSTDDTRIQEMIGNLDYYKRNVPSLFDSWESYSEFFLEGKPRSPEQAKIVEQYYWDYQKYKKYDNYTPEQIGVGLANRTIPNDYLDYLKVNDPMKYGDALNAMNAEKTKIENNASYESMVMNAGIGDSRGGEGYQGKEGGLKDYSIWAGIWKDENNDGIDDRTYFAPTEEETSNQQRRSQLIAEKQRINDLIDDNLKSLQKQYPGASLQTLRVLNSDMNAELYQQLKEIGYEITELGGNIEYLQNERAEKAKAGINSINQLTKNLGMYYEYSAQGMSDLAQAQYAATNVTFDQADKGTYTQKQMALENVLTPIYQQYGSIIDRPQDQVINDIINYAQQNGVGLEEAFNKNFMDFVKAKPEYNQIKQIAAFGKTATDTGSYKTVSTKDGQVIMYNDKTGKWETIDGSSVNITTDGGAAYTPISSSALNTGFNDFYSERETSISEGKRYRNGRCGEFVNEYLRNIGSDVQFGDKVGDKTKYKNVDKGETPAIGSVAIFAYSPNSNVSDIAKEAGHVAIVSGISANGDIELIEQNGDGTKVLGTRTISANSQSLYGFFDPSKVSTSRKTGNYSSYEYQDFEQSILNYVPTQLKNTENEKKQILDKVKGYWDRGMTTEEASMTYMGFDINNMTKSQKEVADKVLSALKKVGDAEEVFNPSDMTSIANLIKNNDFEGALQATENIIYRQGKNQLALSNARNVMSAIDDYEGTFVYGWKEGQYKNLQALVNANSAASAKLDTANAGLHQALLDFGISEDVIENNNMLLDLADTQEKAEQKLKAVRDIVLNNINAYRMQYGMPSLSKKTISEMNYVNVYGLQKGKNLYNLLFN